MGTTIRSQYISCMLFFWSILHVDRVSIIIGYITILQTISEKPFPVADPDFPDRGRKFRRGLRPIIRPNFPENCMKIGRGVGGVGRHTSEICLCRLAIGFIMIQLNKVMYYLQHTNPKTHFFNLICFLDTSFVLIVSNKNNLCISQDTLVFPSDSHCAMKPSANTSAPSELIRVCSHWRLWKWNLRVCSHLAIAKAKEILLVWCLPSMLLAGPCLQWWKVMLMKSLLWR